MQKFLSCDWGTSSFRIRLADTRNGRVLGHISSNEGIAATLNKWRQSGLTENERIPFYLGTAGNHIRELENVTGRLPERLPLFISGMASSALGLKELPYSMAPLPLDGSGLNTLLIEPTQFFPYPTYLISGVKSCDDVMRGEETQLLGYIEKASAADDDIFIFPGTHSKHICIKDGELISIHTCMTGEFFELLSQKSILANDIEPGTAPVWTRESFVEGVKKAGNRSLLQAAFDVRVNHLSGKYNKVQNYAYLSGLLVGSELQSMDLSRALNIHLICSSELQDTYQTALKILAPLKNIKIHCPADANELVVQGHLKIGRYLKLL